MPAPAQIDHRCISTGQYSENPESSLKLDFRSHQQKRIAWSTRNLRWDSDGRPDSNSPTGDRCCNDVYKTPDQMRPTGSNPYSEYCRPGRGPFRAAFDRDPC